MVSKEFQKQIGKTGRGLKKTLNLLLKIGTEDIQQANVNNLLKGETIKGDKITPKYKNPKYASFKNSKNSKPGRGTPDLKVTGRYHKTIKTTRQGEKFTTKAGVVKYQKELKDKYTDHLGAQKKDYDKMINEVSDLLLDEMLKPFYL